MFSENPAYTHIHDGYIMMSNNFSVFGFTGDTLFLKFSQHIKMSVLDALKLECRFA